jgi:hypothetical protein
LNEFKDIAFIPIKSKVLPQSDESTSQSINQISDESTQQSKTDVKSQKDSKASDINKSNNLDKSDESTKHSKTDFKSQKDSKASDINKSNNLDKSVSPSMGIKILSPKSGNEIPVGNLTIFGTSTDNEKSDCSVSVDWNNQKPFQKAKATGPYGSDDYSSWAFTYSPSYHTIENGINELTSKLECVENSKVTTKWHSINVTGGITEDANPTSTLVSHDPLGILPQLKTVSTNPSANSTSIASNETAIAPSKLSAHLVLPNYPVYPEGTQNFTVKILDSNTYQGVEGANLAVKVMQGSVILHEFNGTTDASGDYSWNLNSDTPSGKSDVLVSASADGYEPASITGSFQVKKHLLVEASLLKNLVFPGDKQTIDVKVMDANTKEIVSGANVMAKIGKSNEYNGTSDTSGAFSHSWNITSDTPSGKSDVLVSASADGYEPASITGSFQLQRQLLVEASLLKNLVFPGDKQTIDVKVMDANTKEIVSGANVMAKIGGKNLSEKTDDSGTLTYSWNTPATSGGNKYDVVLDVSSRDYPKAIKTLSFKMDKPQNLLEPPISNYESKIVNVNNKDLDNNLESPNKSLECLNMLSSVGCSPEGQDKPILNPTTTDDKPILNPTTTDDKPILNPTTTDDKPILDIGNENEHTQNEYQKEKNTYDFLSSLTK